MDYYPVFCEPEPWKSAKCSPRMPQMLQMHWALLVNWLLSGRIYQTTMLDCTAHVGFSCEFSMFSLKPVLKRQFLHWKKVGTGSRWRTGLPERSPKRPEGLSEVWRRKAKGSQGNKVTTCDDILMLSNKVSLILESNKVTTASKRPGRSFCPTWSFRTRAWCSFGMMLRCHGSVKLCLRYFVFLFICVLSIFI